MKFLHDMGRVVYWTIVSSVGVGLVAGVLALFVFAGTQVQRVNEGRAAAQFFAELISGNFIVAKQKMHPLLAEEDLEQVYKNIRQSDPFVDVQFRVFGNDGDIREIQGIGTTADGCRSALSYNTLGGLVLSFNMNPLCGFDASAQSEQENPDEEEAAATAGEEGEATTAGEEEVTSTPEDNPGEPIASPSDDTAGERVSTETSSTETGSPEIANE